MFSRNRLARTPQVRRRPAFEVLEDRLVPATFHVTTPADVLDPGEGQLSLREAIGRANQRPGADVVLLPAGVYEIALGGRGLDGAIGDFDITDSVLLKGAGARVTAVDAGQLDRVFEVLGHGPEPIRVTFEGLTIRNGLAPATFPHGGGIQADNADLVVRRCVITGNQADGSGGGISDADAAGPVNVTLVRSVVSHNRAGDGGGGISEVGGTLTVSGSTIRDNRAGYGGGIQASAATVRRSTIADNDAGTGLGGGVFSDSLTVTGSTVSGNRAGDSGGGILAGTLTLAGSTVSDNRVLGDGGGIMATVTATLTRAVVRDNHAGTAGGGIHAATVSLTASRVSRNLAGTGGGIDAQVATLHGTTVSGNVAGTFGGGIRAATAILTNSTVSGNLAGAGAGGLLVTTTAVLLNVTIADNSAHTYCGGFAMGPGANVGVRNTIIAQNRVDANGVPDLIGDFISQGHNLIGNPAGSTGFVNGTSGDRVGTSTRPLDPRLGPLTNNGGRTPTHALLPGSPAIDRGDNAGAPRRDQRGVRRPRDGGSGLHRVDIGAFER